MKKKVFEPWQLFLALLLGVGLILLGVIKWSSYIPTQNWKKTRGYIMGLGTRERSISSIWGHDIRYYAIVRYAYEVDGKQYTADNVPLTQRAFDNEGATKSILDDYKQGEFINVYYLADNPEVSLYVINREGTLIQIYASFLIGGMMVVWALHQLFLMGGLLAFKNQ